MDGWVGGWVGWVDRSTHPPTHPSIRLPRVTYLLLDYVLLSISHFQPV